MIAIVIPTLNKAKGEETGRTAVATAGCSVPVRAIVVHDAKRKGFTKAVNAGICQTSGKEDVCLLNDDILAFQYGWLEILRYTLHLNHRYGLSGPSGKSASAPASKGGIGMSGIQEVNQLSFWCVLMKRAMLDDIGMLDEAFIHYCSDTWYCRVMRTHNWKCVWAKAVYLGHQHHGSGIPGEWKAHDRKIYFKRLGK